MKINDINIFEEPSAVESFKSKLAAVPLISPDVGSIEPIEETGAEKRVRGLANTLQRAGFADGDYRKSYQTAQKLLRIVDPYQQGGIGEFLPGFSYELAQERGDKFGQTLATLDMIPGAAIGTAPIKAARMASKSGIAALKVQKAQELINQGRATAGTATATKKMVQPTKVAEGKIIDVRKNLNSSFDDPELSTFKAQTIHDVKKLKSGKISESESNIGTGSALSYDPAVTVKSNGTPIQLKVNQAARDSIASKTKPKFPMAAVRGIYDDIDIFDPDITLGFNPMQQNVFIDSQGYGVKAIKNGKATVVDNDVLVKLNNPENFKIVEDAAGNQVKLFDDIEYYNIDNLPKTNNPSDVKVLKKNFEGIGPLSKSKALTDEPKDMVFLHNTSASKLALYDNIGGLPSPSMAVTKADTPHGGFGNITLIGKPEKFDPAVDSRNKVYSADAYTPRGPKPIRLAKPGAAEQLAKDYASIKTISLDEYEKLEEGTEALRKLEKDNLYYPQNRMEEVDYFFDSGLAKRKYVKEKGIPDSVLNEYDDFVDYKDYGKFNKWAKAEKDKYLSQNSVFQYFDDAEETLKTVDYNLENVVANMISDTQRGGENISFASDNYMRALTSKIYPNLPSIKADKSRLVPDDSPKLDEAFDSGLDDSIRDVLKSEKFVDPETSADVIKTESVNDILLSVKYELETGQKLETAVNRAVRNAVDNSGFKHINEPSLKSKILKAFEDNANAVVSYFEAKPTRAVGFDEFAGAIVPANTAQSTIDILEKRGLKVIKETPKLTKADTIKQNFGKELFSIAPIAAVASATAMMEDEGKGIEAL